MLKVFGAKVKIIAIIVISTLIIHCGQKSETRTGMAARDTTATIIEPGGTVVIGINGEPDALNPLMAMSEHGVNIISLIFQQLAQLNADLNSFSPQLAKGWEFSEDSLALTFYLRTNVLWHDGQSFTAADVVFTHYLQINPDLAWDGSYSKENIGQVAALNDSTVRYLFKLRSPAQLMDAAEGYIVPKHLLDSIPASEIRNAGFNRQPVGTGPFKLITWKSQQTVILEKFNDFYKPGKPYLDRVIFKNIPSAISLSQQIRSQDIDFMAGIPAIDYIRLKNDWELSKTVVRPVSVLGRSYDFIGWNLIDPDNYAAVMSVANDNPNLDDLLKPNRLFGAQKVRAALTMAINRDQLSEVVNSGLAVAMDGPIPPILWAYNEQANTNWQYDPELATQYLEEAGWRDTNDDGILDKDGVKFSFVMATNSGNERRQKALTIIQDQLKNIGVEMTPRVADPGLLYGQMLASRNFDAVLIGWNVGLKMDFAPLFHSANIRIPFAFPSYHSDDFNQWHEVAVNSLNRTRAQPYWDKIAQLLSNDLPYTWLYYQMDLGAINDRVKGAVFDNRGFYVNPEEWWIPQSKRSGFAKMTAD